MKEKILANKMKIAVAGLIAWNVIVTGLLAFRLPSSGDMQILRSIANPQTFGLAVADIMCRTELSTALSVCPEIERIKAETGIR